MTELRISDDSARVADERLTGTRAIAERLAAIGCRFERVPLSDAAPDRDAAQDEVIEAFRESLDGLMQRYQFATVDVVGLSPQHPRAAEKRDELSREHVHRVAEGRLFIGGRVTFGLRAGGRVYALDCRRGDFIGLPAETGHWLATDDPPYFRSVRLFTDTAECTALEPELRAPGQSWPAAAGAGL